ncbi:MAG: hypothetical protein AB7P99_01650 [Vicinamibacterales bacterium]
MGGRRPTGAWLPPVAFGLLASAFTVSTYQVLDDHFDRLTRARQIVQFGELPFRDFLDPGYFLSLFVSAALQRLLGDHLLGELLLNAACIGAGTGLVLWLARQVSGSYRVAVPAALLAVLAMPRAYDYDKVLFYPLGLACCWAYASRPTARRLVGLAGVVVLAALFRYDSGVYLACAAFATVVVLHRPERRLLLGRGMLLVGAAVVFALPALVFVQATSGIGDAVDQIVTYASRERARTRNRPALTDARLFALVPAAPVPGPPIQVQWAPDVDDQMRLRLEAGLTLTNGAGPGEDRWWGYRLGDPSAEIIQRLVESPGVADTRGVDRAARALERPEPIQVRLERALPRVRLAIPGQRASAFLYHILLALPVVAALVLYRRGASRAEYAAVGSVIIVVALLDGLVLRDPVSARLGGVAGPAAVLGAWLVAQARRPSARVATAIVALLAVAALAAVGEWRLRLAPARLVSGLARERLARLTRVPLPADLMLGEQAAGLVEYLRACAAPDERVYLAWYAPDIYFYAQRGFAGGMPVTFGAHWSDDRFEQRLLSAFTARPPAVAVFETGSFEQFSGDYPRLGAFFAARYGAAATTDFGRDTEVEGRYTVLRPRDERSRRECQTDLVLVAPTPPTR